MALKYSENKDGLFPLSSILTDLMKYYDLDERSLSKLTGIAHTNISRLKLNPEANPTITTLIPIAKAFNITVGQLIGEEYLNIKHLPKKLTQVFRLNINKVTQKSLPILMMDDLKNKFSFENMNLHEHKTWLTLSIPQSQSLSDKAFALKNTSLICSDFPKDTILIIDPDVKPVDEDSILININKNNLIVMRKIKMSKIGWELSQTQSKENNLKYSLKHHFLIGVLIMTIFYTHNSDI